MSVENEGGRNRGDLTRYRNTSPPEGSPVEPPLAPVLGEAGRRGERSHEELVAAFRNAIRLKQREWQDRGEALSPAQIIDFELFQQAQFRYMRQEGEYAHYRQLGEFYYPLLSAWSVIAFDHYGKESDNSAASNRNFAGWNLTDHYQRTGQATIRLSEQQTRVLEALAEAADIPHQKGQAEIDIPEKLRNYEDRPE